jgi:hypothetical protein
MVERHGERTGRPISTGEWHQFVAGLIGPAPPMDHDAAGNPHNPSWWLHYALSVDAQQIRQQGMRVLRGAPMMDP